MEVHFLEFSLVVIAKDHNPTILNPDFLKINHIVKDDLNWQVVGQPITTPAFSTVQYNSNVVITVDPIKLQVTDSSGANFKSNQICDIISNYVNTLPHVEYIALGINFTNMVKIDDPTNYVISRFLKNGGWNNGGNQIQNLGLKLFYDLEGGNIAFSVDKGMRKDVAKPFIISRANFHRDLDLTVMPSSKQIIKGLENIENDWKRFQELHAAIIENG